MLNQVSSSYEAPMILDRSLIAELFSGDSGLQELRFSIFNNFKEELIWRNLDRKYLDRLDNFTVLKVAYRIKQQNQALGQNQNVAMAEIATEVMAVDMFIDKFTQQFEVVRDTVTQALEVTYSKYLACCNLLSPTSKNPSRRDSISSLSDTDRKTFGPVSHVKAGGKSTPQKEKVSKDEDKKNALSLFRSVMFKNRYALAEFTTQLNARLGISLDESEVQVAVNRMPYTETDTMANIKSALMTVICDKIPHVSESVVRSAIGSAFDDCVDTIIQAHDANNSLGVTPKLVRKSKETMDWGASKAEQSLWAIDVSVPCASSNGSITKKASRELVPLLSEFQNPPFADNTKLRRQPVTAFEYAANSQLHGRLYELITKGDNPCVLSRKSLYPIEVVLYNLHSETSFSNDAIFKYMQYSRKEINRTGERSISLANLNSIVKKCGKIDLVMRWTEYVALHSKVDERIYIPD